MRPRLNELLIPAHRWLLWVYVASVVYSFGLMFFYADPVHPMDAVLRVCVNISFGYWAAYLIGFALRYEPQPGRRWQLALLGVAIFAGLIASHFELLMFMVNYVVSVFFTMMAELTDYKLSGALLGIPPAKVHPDQLLQLRAVGPLFGGLAMGAFMGLLMGAIHHYERLLMHIPRTGSGWLKAHFWGGSLSGLMVGFGVLYTLTLATGAHPVLEQIGGFSFSLFMHIPHLYIMLKHEHALQDASVGS